MTATVAPPTVTRTIAYQPALDGLRAWAVFAVVLYHAGATSSLPGLAPGGFLGVSVFFTLSGFLITTLLVRRSDAAAAAGCHLDLGRFWTRRVRRLAPVSLTVVLLAVVLAERYWPGMRASDAAAGVYGYANWHVIASGEDALLRTIVGPLGPFWSLAVEEQFYVLLTLAVVLAWRTARPVRTLSITVVAGWAASVAVQLLVAGPQFRVEFGTDARGAELLAGCGLALLLHVRPGLLAGSVHTVRMLGVGCFTTLAVLVATTDYDPPWLLRGGYGVVSILGAALVAGLLVPGRLTRFLATAPTVFVGRLSYSWYVVHWPVILIVRRELDGLDRWAAVAVKVVASFAAAVVLHLTVEEPLRHGAAPGRTVTAMWATATAVVTIVALAIL